MLSAKRKFKSHECELVFRNIDEYTNKDDRLNIVQRVLASLLESFLVSRKHPRTRKKFPSSAAIKNERIRHIRTCYYTIHPCSLFRIQWETFMVVVFILSLIVIPYNLAFILHQTNKFASPFFNATIISDFCCYVNILVNFFTGCYVTQSKDIHLELKVIAKHYLRGRFILDLISSLHISLFVHNTPITQIWGHDAFYLLKVLRVFCLRTYLQSVTARFEIEYVTAKLIKSLIVLSLYVHWMACMSYFVVRLVQGSNHEKYDIKSWVVDAEFDKKEPYEKYWACVFRAVSNMMACTYGIQIPKTIEDIIWCIIVSLSGTLTLIFTLVQVMQMLKTQNVSRYKCEEMAVELSDFMHHKQFPEELQRKLREHYKFSFQKGYFREDMIVDFISGQLRDELRMHSCRRLVENVTFFENIPNNLMLSIVARIRSEIYFNNEVVIKAGTRGDAMYFLASGCVAVYTASGREVTHLVDGAHFGEVVLVMENETRIASVVAVETSEIYSLSRDDFRTAVAPYPVLLKLIEDSARKRVEATLKMDEQNRRKLSQDNGGTDKRRYSHKKRHN